MMMASEALNYDMYKYKMDSKGLKWVILFVTMTGLMYSEELKMAMIMGEEVVTCSVLMMVVVETGAVVVECFPRKQVY